MGSQVEKIYNILKDGLPHRFDEIQESLFGGTKYGAFRLGARIFDIKEKYGVEINGWKDRQNPSLYWYQLKVKEPDDIDRLFKSVRPVFGQGYVDMANAYNKYLKAKTDNDKKRLENEFKFYYRNFSSL